VTDEGWTRYLFDRKFFIPERTIPYRSITNRDLAPTTTESAPMENGIAKLRVLVLPSLTADLIINGNRGDEWPPEFRGGIGEAGAASIDRFVRQGGTLIALKDATALPIQLFRMPLRLRNAIANLPEGRRLTIPGAILRVDLDTQDPIAQSMDSSVPALFDNGKAFDLDDSADRDQSIKPVILGRWAPVQSLRLAGYAEGLDLLAGRGAIVRCRVGRGQVILFGFSPQFRSQTFATFELLWNALRSGIGGN
jgi:hypothetical protein